jgi:phosphate transport system permease protein
MSVEERGMSVFEPLSRRRRMTDKAAEIVLGGATLLALVPLVLVLWLLISRGIGTWTVAFFTKDPTGAFLGDPGGIRSAILGTIEMVIIASAIAIPVGVAIGVFLVEYGKSTIFATIVRYFVDVMTGVPSIVFGLFIYITLVLSGAFGTFAAWKGAVALALLMLPVVTRSAEVVLTLVPDSIREAALALGAPRWRVVFGVVLPAALPGLVTGSLLAISRAAGETAPLLFTAFAAQELTFDPGGPMNSLPIQIFNDVQNPNPALVARAWGAALTLVLLVCLTNLVARLLSRRASVTI